MEEPEDEKAERQTKDKRKILLTQSRPKFVNNSGIRRNKYYLLLGKCNQLNNRKLSFISTWFVLPSQ
jgi:hypothetical protein